MIYAKSLTKTYHLPSENIHALKSIALSVKTGEFAAIMGPSGAGKTTLLNLLGGLDIPTCGTLRLANQNWNKRESARVKMRRQLVGFVFQEFLLLPQLTALENVMLPYTFTKQSDRQHAEELLAQVGLTERIYHRPSELSGGEMQRVAIARALANRHQILLADEPTGNLDIHNSQLVFDMFRTLSRTQGLTIVVATHNFKLAQFADWISYLKDGRIVSGTRERGAQG